MKWKNEIIHDAEVLKSNLCDYNDAYILARADITVAGNSGTKLVIQNCAPFTKCIRKLVEQPKMMLKIYIWSCQCVIS